MTTRTSFNCAHPSHEGDRRVRHFRDQVVLALVAWTKDGKEMLFRIPASAIGRPADLCRTCAQDLEAALRGREPDVHQGALL